MSQQSVVSRCAVMALAAMLCATSAARADRAAQRRVTPASHPPGGPPGSTPPRAPGQPVPRAQEAPVRYLELSLYFGAGKGGSTRSVDNDDELDDALAVVGMSGVWRHGAGAVGVVLEGAGEAWGLSHDYAGVVGGIVNGGTRGHLDVLGEVGVHQVTPRSRDLVLDANRDAKATLPYAGFRLRLILDPGQPGDVVVDLSARMRMDLGTQELAIQTSSGSGPDRYEIGGSMLAVTAGVGYRFD